MLSFHQKNNYLKRINTPEIENANLDSLENIHRAHLIEVPFENFDIIVGDKISLIQEDIFEKIVTRNRGGFCYELNGCLFLLLKSIGFDVKMISARVYDDSEIGPEFDHLCLIVKINGFEYLVDVGFGDSFSTPLKINGNVSVETYKSFRVIKNAEVYTLLKSDKANIWTPQYDFTLKEYHLSDFSDMCHFHQTSKKSHFTQNTICTHLTKKDGRVTLSKNKVIHSESNVKSESIISSLEEYITFLHTEFKITLKNHGAIKNWFVSTEASGT